MRKKINRFLGIHVQIFGLLENKKRKKWRGGNDEITKNFYQRM